MINLSESQKTIVQDIFARYPQIPLQAIYVFGSRTKGNAVKSSDLDLLIHASHKLAIELLFKLKDDFEESSLPFRVDLVDYHRINAPFYHQIAPDCEPLFTHSNTTCNKP